MKCVKIIKYYKYYQPSIVQFAIYSFQAFQFEHTMIPVEQIVRQLNIHSQTSND